MPLTQEQIECYLADDYKCPVCRSDSIEGGSVYLAGKSAFQTCTCGNCSAEWQDIYQLSTVKLTKDPEPVEHKRVVSFEEACREYTNRFTMEHKPAWADTPMGNGRHYAPQYRSDREWYERTTFPNEPDHLGTMDECHSTRATWPLGTTLAEPFEPK